MEDTIIGKTIVFGINRLDEQDQLLEQTQYFGKITATDDQWLDVELDSGETERIPFANIIEAPRGAYTSRSGKVKATNPDLIASWATKPAPERPGAVMYKPNSAPLMDPEYPREWELDYVNDPEYVKDLIDKKGRQYIGKTVLIGLTYLQRTEQGAKVMEQKQIHGQISQVTPQRIEVTLSTNQKYSLPPDLTMLQPARPGVYRLKASGDALKGINFITQWHVMAPEKGQKPPAK